VATCIDCARIARAAYFTATNQWDSTPPGHMVDGWTVQKWETGTLFGNGFQGGIWQNAHSVVVGCCGTNPHQKGKLASDLSADLRIGTKILPNQSSSANKMVQAAKQIAQGRRLMITGHSLGGALAQVVGVWQGVPFITFNAPPMFGSMRVALANVFKPMMMARTVKSQKLGDTAGVNFIVPGDLISSEWVDKHVGMVVELPRTSPTDDAHAMMTVYNALRGTDWAGIDPFG
jgi:hypothetical protein